MGLLKQLFFVHSIFHFWFLVTLGEEVTKIRKYYIIFVYILQSKIGKTEQKGKKITQLKWPKYQKPKDENMGWTKHRSNYLVGLDFQWFLEQFWGNFEAILRQFWGNFEAFFFTLFKAISIQMSRLWFCLRVATWKEKWPGCLKYSNLSNK